jgi:hypothetical protein
MKIHLGEFYAKVERERERIFFKPKIGNEE